MNRRTLLTTPLIIAGAIGASRAHAQAAADRDNTLVMTLKDNGRVVIRMRPDLAPLHVERIKLLTRRGFYDGTPFHRVMEGFMAQGGDPTGTGTSGSDLPNLRDEFSPPSRARFLRGTCGMAKTQAPNTANSQFFIMFAPNSSLDGGYTIWGQVTEGMEFVDRIKRGVGGSGMVSNPPDRLIRMRMLADA
jgi:cyclophilin family peptidyl-prolyl cis-trans isomerase